MMKTRPNTWLLEPRRQERQSIRENVRVERLERGLYKAEVLCVE